MCNVGKFIDRSPSVRAAGLPVPCDEKVHDNLRDYPKFELAEKWIKSKCAKKPPSELFATKSCLPNDSVHETLTPELQKSRFAKFREQFFEDMYLKKPELGRVKQVHSIPEHVHNFSQTFGNPTTSTQSLYELVLPRKSVAEINREYYDWHSKYVLSHNHYFPGEQIRRSYNEKFDANAKFGKPTNVDATGKMVKRCLTQSDKPVLVKGLQKYYLEREFNGCGRKVSKFNDPHLSDPQRIFGHPPNPNKCRSQDIVHNIDPCAENDELVEAISYLHNQRHKIHSNPYFDIYEMELALRKHDESNGNTGYLSLKQALEIAGHLDLHLNEHKMRLALSFYKYLLEAGQPSERIRMEDFSKALQSQFLLPEVQYKDAKGTTREEMDTIYRQFCRDNSKPLPPALVYRKKPVDDGGDEVIGPEAFDRLREKSQLQRIFSDIVCASTFEQIWEAARKKNKIDENNQISINDFRGVLRELRAAKKN